MSKKHIDGWFGAIEKQRNFLKKSFKKEQYLELNLYLIEGLTRATNILLESIKKDKLENSESRDVLKDYLLKNFYKKLEDI
jgi:hypothetical protein